MNRATGRDVEWNRLGRVDNLHDRLLERVPQRKFVENVRIPSRQIGDDQRIFHDVLNHLRCDQPRLGDLVGTDGFLTALFGRRADNVLQNLVGSNPNVAPLFADGRDHKTRLRVFLFGHRYRCYQVHAWLGCAAKSVHTSALPASETKYPRSTGHPLPASSRLPDWKGFLCFSLGCPVFIGRGGAI